MTDAQVVDFNDRNYWSLSQLSKTFCKARETIGKRLGEAGVLPAKQRHGHDVYHIADAARAILSDQLVVWEGVDDPDKLPPKERLEWYRGENEKAKHLRESGELVLAGDVASEMAAIVKICVRALDTMPDVVEMRVRPGAEVVEKLREECDKARRDIAAELEK